MCSQQQVGFSIDGSIDSVDIADLLQQKSLFFVAKHYSASSTLGRYQRVAGGSFQIQCILHPPALMYIEVVMTL